MQIELTFGLTCICTNDYIQRQLRMFISLQSTYLCQKTRTNRGSCSSRTTVYVIAGGIVARIRLLSQQSWQLNLRGIMLQLPKVLIELPGKDTFNRISENIDHLFHGISISCSPSSLLNYKKLSTDNWLLIFYKCAVWGFTSDALMFPRDLSFQWWDMNEWDVSFWNALLWYVMTSFLMIWLSTPLTADCNYSIVIIRNSFPEIPIGF